MLDQPYANPEPVPVASQLAVLPFLAAVQGFLSREREVPELRITMHRAMSRNGEGYLQQVCAYVRPNDLDGGLKVGRTFGVNYGIIGNAYSRKKIWRTKRFGSVDEVRRELRREIERVQDGRDPERSALSYAAIPFLNADEAVVLILYMDCKELNFFADDERLGTIVAMCTGFAKVFDWLQVSPLGKLRNFALPEGTPVGGEPTVYLAIQEEVAHMAPPRFSKVNSFNYQAAVG